MAWPGKLYIEILILVVYNLLFMAYPPKVHFVNSQF